MNCDIVIPDDCVSRKHATLSLANGQYVYHDMSKNGTVINGRHYQNEQVVVTPGTPIYLSGKVPLSWPQVMMLMPQAQGDVTEYYEPHETKYHRTPAYSEETIGVGWGIVSFLFPIIGFILYFVWKDSSNRKAKQAANIAWISIGISFVIGFISGLTM